MSASYRFSPRGIGFDWRLTCLCCGLPDLQGRAPSDDALGGGLLHNVAAFVSSKADGEAIVALFGDHGARLDFREREPSWIQVKVGACDAHLANLEDLERLSRAAGGRISAEMVAAVREPKT